MADATRRDSVRLSLDDAARVKQELREVGETGQRSLERILTLPRFSGHGLRPTRPRRFVPSQLVIGSR